MGYFHTTLSVSNMSNEKKDSFIETIWYQSHHSYIFKK